MTNQFMFHLASPKQRRYKNTHQEGEKDAVIHEEASEPEVQFLNRDVLERVFHYLSDSTRVQFSAVCRFWRWVAQSCCLKAPGFPWLILSAYCINNFLIIFSLRDGVTYALHIPGAKGWRCCGTCMDWLIMQNTYSKWLLLIDPLSNVKIRLPITVRDSSHASVEQMPIISIAFLSSTPKSYDGANNPNCLVVAVSSTHLHLCRLGDQSWTRRPLDRLGVKCAYYNEMLLHERLLIVKEYRHNRIMVFEFDHHLNCRLRHSFSLARIGRNIRTIKSYLVEWCGELFLVFHTTSMVLDVYKFNSRWNLEKVSSLGDGMILLFNDRPKCFSVEDFPALNLKSNCICYFPHLAYGDLSGQWYTPRAHY